MRRLILLRHAKSDWNAAYGADHERPLNGRGRKAAKAIGAALARSGEAPDLVLTSPALRAQSTLELAAMAGKWSAEIQVERGLYGASPAGILETVALTPDDITKLMLVGHQPTWGALARALTGASIGIKTATVIGIDLAIPSWGYAPGARGSIAYVLQPRLFTDGTWDLA